MMIRAPFLLLLASACHAAPPRQVIVRAGRLIDGSGAPAREDMRLHIRDGVIVAIEADEDGPVGEGIALIDARADTVMPGLVNSHAHLFTSGACHVDQGSGLRQAIRNLHALLRGGVTTVADLGAPARSSVALRRHVGTARHRGPRVLVSGPIITVEGGYPTDILDDAAGRDLARPVSSRLGAVGVVRDLVAAGVDVIKVGLQETSYNGKPLPLLAGKLLCTVVEVAHDQELRVLAHATTRQSYEAALDCRVDAIVHGCLEPLDDPLIERIREAGIPITPTHFVFEAPLWGPKHLEVLEGAEARELLSTEVQDDLRAYAQADRTSKEVLPPFLLPGISRAAAEKAVEANLANTHRLHQAGVVIGLGTDAANCFNLHGSPLTELERLAQAGLSNAEVLRAATWGGARILNLHDALGRLAPGYRADLIVVEGRPDENLQDIRRVRLVMIDGVVQSLDGPSAMEILAGAWRLGWATLSD
jgi:imidazolonepropionase-like amidohydrolase